MKQGEIWLIDLDPAKGAEIKKTRPAVIVNDNSLGRLPLKIIIPITDWKDHYEIAPWFVKIAPDSNNGLFKISAADCFQIRSLSEERLIRKLGYIDFSTLYSIQLAIKQVLNL
ncbi:MAG: type II toxin-antitoxin system PemK/MazF family toxin [Tannerella sp.]|jgi:mRNA interferase MazF|nr:type II toxin-antitoxin system PemK/MazF family toxin [Tannerella sp.]